MVGPRDGQWNGGAGTGVTDARDMGASAANHNPPPSVSPPAPQPGRGRPNFTEKPQSKGPSAKRGVSLPRLAVRRVPSSISSQSIKTPDLPSMPYRPVHIVRDSMASLDSQSSSSIYPPSTNDASSFLDIAGDEKPPVSAECFNPDDISYRLRLLVNNNYYLPPAHSKPTMSALSPTLPAKPVKPPQPRFFDFLRKSKTNPPTPQIESPVIDIGGPFLRNTADTSTIEGLTPPPPLLRPRANSASRVSRNTVPTVVVVREKLANLSVAVSPLEHDRRSHDHHRSPTHVTDIDPTDSVDSPLLNGLGHPDTQLHGLGIFDPPDAAQLAQYLPPPTAVSTPASTPEPWRKALLHEVVSLSLSSSGTPNGSFADSRVTSPAHSFNRAHSQEVPRKSNNSTREPAKATPDIIVPNSRILDPRVFNREDSPNSTIARRHPHTSGGRGEKDEAKIRKDMHLTLPIHPVRSETPNPIAPLSPAPRRSPCKQHRFVQSESDEPSPVAPFESASLHAPERPLIRKSISSPMLHDPHSGTSTEHDGPGFLTPTSSTFPLAPHAGRLAELAKEVNDSHNELTSFSEPSSSLLSPGPSEPRKSFAASVSSGRDLSAEMALSAESVSGRASSDMRSPSPFAQRSFGMKASSRLSHFSIQSSAGPSRPVSSTPRDSAEVTETVPLVESRFSAMSPPPPRQSTSVAPLALAPAPRGRRTHTMPIPSPSRSPPPLAPDSASSVYYSTAPSSDSLPEIRAPSPTTPTFGDMHQNVDNSKPPRPSFSSLNSGRMRAPSINSVAESAIGFFDSIQEAPGILAVDGDEESSDEEDEQDMYSALPMPSIYGTGRGYGSTASFHSQGSSSHSVMHPPTSPRPSNHSSTSLHSSLKSPSRSSFRNQGIGNTPTRSTFFSDKKREGNAPATSLQFYAYSQASRSALSISTTPESLGVPGRMSTSTSPISPQSARFSSDDRRRESTDTRGESRRLDGMLLQHIEAERKQIRRITHNPRV